MSGIMIHPMALESMAADTVATITLSLGIHDGNLDWHTIASDGLITYH